MCFQSSQGLPPAPGNPSMLLQTLVLLLRCVAPAPGDSSLSTIPLVPLPCVPLCADAPVSVRRTGPNHVQTPAAAPAATSLSMCSEWPVGVLRCVSSQVEAPAAAPGNPSLPLIPLDPLPSVPFCAEGPVSVLQLWPKLAHHCDCGSWDYCRVSHCVDRVLCLCPYVFPVECQSHIHS